MKKVAVIGAGNVGGTTAMRISESGLAQVVLVDIAEKIAKAKAFDLEDSRYALGIDSRVEASADMSAIAESDIVVVTAGFPRLPGMSREDLLAKNSKIIESVSQAISSHASGAIVIVVSNPLDVMTYLTLRKTGLSRERVFGMGPNLDSSRFANIISEKLFVGVSQVEALVIGSHGETMLPLPRFSSVRGKPLTELLKPKEIEELVERTRKRGAEIVSLYGSGSAYYAPSAAILEIVRAILSENPVEIPVSMCLEGEYGLSDVAIGVPALIGAGGIKKPIILNLNATELKALKESAKAIKESLKLLNL